MTFKLEYNDRIGYFNWDGRTYSKDENEIEINDRYAKEIGFNEYPVSVNCIKNVSSCEEAFLVTSPKDLEIIELNNTYLEDNIMNQIKIIWKDQVFPIWINKYLIFVKVIQTYPDTVPVKLVTDTRFDIKAKKFGSEIYTSDKSSCTEQKTRSIFSILTRIINYNESSFDKTENNELMKTSLDFDLSSAVVYNKNKNNFISKDPIDLIARVIPLESFYSDCKTHSKILDKMKNLVHSSILYIGSSVINVELDCFVANIRKCLSPTENDDEKMNNSSFQKDKKKKNDDDFKFNSTIVQVITFNDYEISCNRCFKKELNTILQTNYIVVPNSLRKALGLEISSKIHLQSINWEPSLPEEINFVSVSNSVSLSGDFEKYKNQWCENMRKLSQPFVFCNNTFISLPTETGIDADFIIKASFKNSSEVNGQQPYGVIDPYMLSKITLANEIMQPIKINGIKLPCQNLKIIDQDFADTDFIKLGGINTLSTKGASFLELWLNLSPLADSILPKYFSTPVLLICGPRGTGKSSLAQNLIQKISKSPYYVYHHIISCRKLQGKRAEVIWKSWRKECNEIIHRQPSILLIDDFDIIAPAPLNPEQERSTDGLHYHKIVNTFLNLIELIRFSESKICIIVTAKSPQSLHPLLTSTRGNHIFQLTLEINTPNKEQRESIVKALIESKPYLIVDCKEYLSKFAFKTEGCVAEDLNILLNRATHSAWMRVENRKTTDKELHLTEIDFDTALKNYLPLHIRGINLYKSESKSWSDIGGLSDIKKTLYEILFWPLKYPTLFENCPIRLQSGILLYGPPGTGKTLLASVIAKESGYNFITVKGPEILSKYIGASEQALRNIFENAQSAKPCILFFDEFDALAPRRGHDSTGVTDRIVNQLLTQMDGVEILKGVYILAATSRPDLIDPALLRPGRFDKHLFCPLPNEEERLEILQALSRKLHLSSDVDFEYLAAATANFSGADLQSLLYSAQIESLHHLNDQRKQNKSENVHEFSDIIYIPSLEQGVVGITEEYKDKILKEVGEIQNNIFGKQNYVEIIDDQMINQTPCITQSNLINVLSKMKPSVSQNERLRYQTIYDSFRGGSDLLPRAEKKRVTLA
ncbi:peroxisome biogenesis factor 1-like isoform X1 [Centruroides sculpturatus]|uniref:peroxisome biogenesis factor 1-like isoform X1 n=2 Tax=Centruroides sculpturatus TaxID=218467 RepID=UPI000C6C932F|nr:peroxisome biogenesis factor 1-like isoform X1 [Centruroides sculpturatus]